MHHHPHLPSSPDELAAKLSASPRNLPPTTSPAFIRLFDPFSVRLIALSYLALLFAIANLMHPPVHSPLYTNPHLNGFLSSYALFFLLFMALRPVVATSDLSWRLYGAILTSSFVDATAGWPRHVVLGGPSFFFVHSLAQTVRVIP